MCAYPTAYGAAQSEEEAVAGQEPAEAEAELRPLDVMGEKASNRASRQKVACELTRERPIDSSGSPIDERVGTARTEQTPPAVTPSASVPVHTDRL